MGDFERLVERISKLSGLSVEEVEGKVEAKREKLSGLISREGAAQVVSAELGVSLEEGRVKLNELTSDMKKINTIGKITRIFPVRSFTMKSGDEGKVSNFFIGDDTSMVKVVLWDMNHIEMIESEKLKEGSVIEIINGSMRDGEIHLRSFSELKESNEDVGEVQTVKPKEEKNLKDFSIGDSAVSRAFVVQAFDPRFFYVCPECKKKVVSGDDGFVCAEHGKVEAEKRALINIVLDDGTETARAVLFHEQMKDLGLTAIDNEDLLKQQKENVLGKEMVFTGNVRMNTYFKNPEFIVNEVCEIDLDSLI